MVHPEALHLLRYRPPGGSVPRDGLASLVSAATSRLSCPLAPPGGSGAAWGHVVDSGGPWSWAAATEAHMRLAVTAGQRFTPKYQSQPRVSAAPSMLTVYSLWSHLITLRAPPSSQRCRRPRSRPPGPNARDGPFPRVPLRVNLSLALPATRKAGPSGCPARSARPHRPSSQPSLLSARNLLSLPGGSALGPRCLGGDQPLPPGADLPATPLTNTTNSSLARCAPPRAALGTRGSSTSCRRKPEPREVRNARRVTQPGRRRRLSDCRAMCPHCPPLCQGHISQVPAASHCPPAHTFPRSPSGRNLTAVPKPP